MTSFLAFAWRKSLSSPSNHGAALKSNDLQRTTSHDSPHMFHEHIGISSSSSGETLSCQPNVDSLFDEMVKSHPTVLDGRSFTPDVLKVRKTPQEIREELGLPPKRLYDENQGGVEHRLHRFVTSPILPPMPPAEGVRSPQVSMASFYPMTSDTSDDNIARSPSLRPGEAKTAVGALLSMNDDAKRMVVTSQSRVTRLLPESSILPSREWLRDDRSVEEATDFSIELPYELLNETHVSFSAFSQAGSVDGGSIRSLLPENLPDTSFTKGFLEHTAKDSYDFKPLVNEIFSADALTSADSSRMSQSTSKDDESIKSMVSENGGGNGVGNGDEAICDYLSRRETEYLVLSILERLRDDSDFVSDIMTMHKKTDNRLFCDSVPITGRNGMLSGFSPKIRDEIVKALDTRLKRYSSSSEVFQILAFCRSLTHASGSLREESAVQVISTSQTYRWRVISGVRAALGLNEDPRSPTTIRGGDTSLFSLPSESANDSTPHTSNVSMTSTITTAVSPERNPHDGANSNGERLRQTMDILCIGLSMLGDECVKLADAQSHDSGTTIKAIHAIQNVYNQLMMLPRDELKTLIDSFELDVLDVSSIARIVSADENDERIEISSRFHSSWGPTENKEHGFPQLWRLSVDSVPYDILEEEEPAEEQENQDLFSPTTLDMLSVDILTTPASADATIDDDLRRTVGSFDNEDDPEGRDEPPALELQRQAMRGKRTKQGKGLFGRRPFRRRQAAE